jgi:hypothetical protein
MTAFPIMNAMQLRIVIRMLLLLTLALAPALRADGLDRFIAEDFGGGWVRVAGEVWQLHPHWGYVRDAGGWLRWVEPAEPAAEWTDISGYAFRLDANWFYLPGGRGWAWFMPDYAPPPPADWTVATVAPAAAGGSADNLRALTPQTTGHGTAGPTASGVIVKAAGYYLAGAAGDGAFGDQVYALVRGADLADNGGTVIKAHAEWDGAGAAAAAFWSLRFSGAASVLWFGARGDAASDDSAAFAACIAAHPMTRVPVAPRGDYYIAGDLTLPSGHYIHGDGGWRSYIKMPGRDWGDTNARPAAVFRLPAATHAATVKSLRMHGNKGAHSAVNMNNVEIIDCNGTENLLENLFLHDAEADGVDIDGIKVGDERLVQGNIVRNCVIMDCGGWGIHNSINSRGNIIEGNIVTGCGFARNRGGIDSYWGNDVSQSWGEHVFSGNHVFANRQNWSIRGRNPSLFIDNELVNDGQIADNLSMAIIDPGP